MRSLLPTRKMRPRDPTALVLRPVLEDVRAALPEKHAGKLWAIDIETNGLDATDPACVIVGIGMAREHGVVYVHMQDAPAEVREYVGQFLRGSRLIAFNVFFDGAFLERDFGPMQWELDAYALYKQLSLEGWTGQSWGLESAQTDVLGWPTSNKTALTAALAEHGLSKGEMFKLPPEILGRYCSGDADSTWQLYGVLMDAVKPFPRLWDYHTRIFMTTVRLLIEQQRRGIYVDQTRLAKCRADLATKIDAAMTAFLGHPDVAHFVAQYNQEVHDAWKRAAPPQFKKDGTETARYQNWRAKEATLIAEQGFNPNSKDQLRWLFFDKLGMKSVKTTESGKGAVNKQTLPTLGKPGALLMDYNLYVKRLQFADATAAKSARDGLIHPQFNSVGTVTTRLGGSGGFNCQQLTKTPDYLACLQARDGHRLVQSDTISLEPCILAEFSGDATLMKLYGPGAAEQDVYLFVGAQLPGIGEVIRQYYDPNNPTPESIAAAKKACKRERNIAKLVHLSSSYGASASKIFETLTLAGVDTTLREVRALHAAYWRLFRGVKVWETRLTRMWTGAKGWIPSVLGTPLCVAEDKLKDLVSRHTQASGHLLIQLWVYHIDKMRRERGVEMYPWIFDLHDETIWEAPEAHAAAAAQILDDALRAAVAELELTVPIRGEPQIVANMAEVKTKKEYDEMIEDEEGAA